MIYFRNLDFRWRCFLRKAPLGFAIIGALLVGVVSVAQAAIPTYQAVGAAQDGTGAVTPTWPAHQAGDVALLFVESAGGEAVTLSTPAGFVEVLNSPQSTGTLTTDTRITVFWARATSAAMADPVVADAGNHVNAQILTYRGVVSSGNPWDVTSGGTKPVASTSVTVTGVTTITAETLVVQVCAQELDSNSAGFSAQTNANLTNILERTDIGTNRGNGGGFAVWDGGKASAGATGDTTATVLSSVNAFMTIALKPLLVSASSSTVVASPTSVSADGVTSATITVTLKDAAGTLIAGKTVTLDDGPGSSIITTVSGVTNASGVATFTVKNSVIEGPLTYTATTDGITITQTAQVTFTDPKCFIDDFNRATPGTNWSVGNKSQNTTGFTNPVISALGRLQLTDAGQYRSTWATLQRMIPAAGNKATIEFDYFASGGTGADGVAIVLSDASIAPQAGAFGGSLGYAQKGYTPISDCTTVGGCPGFAGGWLGIGLDEFGNYSRATEGRFGGNANLTPNSVAIRGSGSGMAGYRYLTGSVVTPGVGTTTAHRYRIVIDGRTSSTHAWASVERDTAGGTAYTVLIGCADGGSTCPNALDLRDPGYSQNIAPLNLKLSITGSTGGSTNIHEIDNLKICTEQELAAPTLHHIKIEHNGTACTTNPATITIKACADTDCTALYQNSVTVTLASAPGGTWAPVSPITFTGGSTTVTLTDTTARPDTLTATATLPVASFATVYSPSNILTFSVCTFDAVEVGKAAYTPIYTKLAGTLFSLNVLSLAGTQTPTAVTLVDASSGTCSTYSALVNSSTALAAISAGTPKRFDFTYANAAPNVRVRVTKAGPVYSCSSDNFAIRPTAFTLTARNAADVILSNTAVSGTPIATAGAAFSLKADSGQTLYNGVPKLNGSLLHKGTPTTQILGSLSTAAFLAASSGVSTASNLTYSEVGNFVFGVNTVYDDKFTAVDATKASPECTPDFNSGTPVNGMFGCMFGNTAAINVGRFVPDHFNTMVVQTGTSPALVPMACATGLTCPTLFNGMVYSGQPFKLTLTAKNASDATTVNYDTTIGFAKTSALSVVGGLGVDTAVTGAGALGVTSLATFSAGVATEAEQKYTFTTVPTVPTNIYIRSTDSDTPPVSSKRAANPTTTSVEGGVTVVSGRIKIPNAYGSELLPMSLAATVQYYNASGSWVTNLMDSATSLSFTSASSAGLTVTGVPGSSTTFTAGIISMILNSQKTAGTVTVTGTPTAPSSLSAASGTATFGIYKGNNKFIYLRESY